MDEGRFLDVRGDVLDDFSLFFDTLVKEMWNAIFVWPNFFNLRSLASTDRQ